MSSKPPWARFTNWANSRDRIIELLREAVEVRADVTRRLDDPKSNVACRGYVFFHFWVARVGQLAETTPYWKAIDPARGVFALDDLPVRLYRAPEDGPVPKRVLKVSEAETHQMTIFDLFGVEVDEEGTREPDHVLRIRVVTDVKGLKIEQFVFEEITIDGHVDWEWSIDAAAIPERFEVAVAKQPPAEVRPRRSGTKRSSSGDDEA